MHIFRILFILFTISLNSCSRTSSLPHGFVFLSDIDPTIIENVRYNTDQSFLGRPALGYIADTKSSHTRGSTFDLTRIKYNDTLNPIIYSKRRT